MKRMKRLTCTLAALAMVMWTHISAKAEFKGKLQGGQPWLFEISSGPPDAMAVTVYYWAGALR